MPGDLSHGHPPYTPCEGTVPAEEYPDLAKGHWPHVWRMARGWTVQAQVGADSGRLEGERWEAKAEARW